VNAAALHVLFRAYPSSDVHIHISFNGFRHTLGCNTLGGHF
jgi:hypothetical protein